MWCILLCSISTGGHIRCACPPEGSLEPPGPEVVVDEPAPEPDAGRPEEIFECPNLLGRSCKTDDDCRRPQPPPPKKPYCPHLYCGDDAAHGRNITTDPTKPGTLPWNRGYHPKRDECECKVECASFVCLQGTCQAPPPEPVPEPPPPPDIPPGCPDTCETNADCPENLCNDRTTCDPEKKVCINPFVRP